MPIPSPSPSGSAKRLPDDRDSTAATGGEAGAAAQTGPGKASGLLSVSQAADYLHLSESTIRSYIRQGRLRAFRVAGLRKVLIPREELLGLLEPARSAE